MSGKISNQKQLARQWMSKYFPANERVKVSQVFAQQFPNGFSKKPTFKEFCDNIVDKLGHYIPEYKTFRGIKDFHNCRRIKGLYSLLSTMIKNHPELAPDDEEQTFSVKSDFPTADGTQIQDEVLQEDLRKPKVHAPPDSQA